jgi:hypothetical protein
MKTVSSMSPSIASTGREPRAWLRLHHNIIGIMRRQAFMLLPAAVLLAAACSDPSGPSGSSGLTVIAARTADTIGATLPDIRIVVRDSTGKAIPDAEVLVKDLHRGDTRVFLYLSQNGSGLIEARTNAAGEATATVRFGPNAGNGLLEIVYWRDDAAVYVDTVEFDVLPGAAVSVVPLPRDTALQAGRSYSLQLRAADRNGNVRSEVVPVSSFTALGDELRVSTTGTVMTDAVGRAAIELAAGAWVDTAWVSVIPAGTIMMSSRWLSPLGLYMSELDGSDFRLITTRSTSSLGMQWHPDASGVIMHGLDFLRPDGTVQEVHETPRQFQHKAWPEYSIDGEWLYFEGFLHQQWNHDMRIWRMRADGSAVEQVSTIHASGPSPSPDGTRVVYSSLERLIVHELGTGATTTIADGFAPRWSPTGDWIAFKGQGSLTEHALYVIRPDGSDLRRLGTDVFSTGLDWSPDGRYIVAGAPEQRFHILRVEDGEDMPLNAFTVLFNQAAWRP